MGAKCRYGEISRLFVIEVFADNIGNPHSECCIKASTILEPVVLDSFIFDLGCGAMKHHNHIFEAIKPSNIFEATKPRKLTVLNLAGKL